MEKKKFEFIPSFENVAYTDNGALSYETTTSVMVDQFGKAGSQRGREISEVFAEQEALWAENNIQALRFPFYLRMITRKVKVNGNNATEKVQKGQGARDESFKRLLWLAAYVGDTFYKNIWVLPLVGSWKDIWTLMYYDVKYGVNAISHEIMFTLINEGLKSGTHSELIKKYMPRIKAMSKCNTDWTKITNSLAKEYAKFNHLSYQEYNRIKSSGTAHDFQKLICSGRYSDINWNLIPGRALSMLTNGKFIKNHKLVEDYLKWADEQPTIKYTGYVYELFKQIKSHDETGIKNLTIDKQFDGLVEQAGENGRPIGNVWCALDTSGSMTMPISGASNTSCYDVCVSLGIFFSTLNQGAFHKNVIMFDDKSYPLRLEGTFSQMAEQIRRERTAWGSTNFMSVIRTIVDIRKKNPNIPLEDYPDTLLVVSDMQFNPVSVGTSHTVKDAYETNYTAMKKMLYEHFPKEFVDNMKFIWWQVNGSKKDVPATVGSGQMFISGFDGSIISLLLGEEAKKFEQAAGRPMTSEEVVALSLSQEILSYVNV